MIFNPMLVSAGAEKPLLAEVKTIAEILDQPERPTNIAPGITVIFRSVKSSGGVAWTPVLIINTSQVTLFKNVEVYVGFIDTTFILRFEPTGGLLMVQDGTDTPVLLINGLADPPVLIKDGYSVKHYKFLA